MLNQQFSQISCVITHLLNAGLMIFFFVRFTTTFATSYHVLWMKFLATCNPKPIVSCEN